MSTIEQSKQVIPTGTWQADTVHSRVTFEVPYAVATFRGDVPKFEATLEDGNADRSRADLQHPGQGRESRGAPPVAGVLRRRAAPRGAVRLDEIHRTATTSASRAR